MNQRTIFQATENDFETTVIARSSRIPVLVDFWAEWCPPCKTLNPVLERVARKLDGTLELAKVEVDDNMHLAGRYHLTGFPSVLLFIDGEEVDRFAGARSEEKVFQFLEGHLSLTR